MIQSKPYRPGEQCCERCVFGTGSHLTKCPVLMDEFFENYIKPALDDNELLLRLAAIATAEEARDAANGKQEEAFRSPWDERRLRELDQAYIALHEEWLRSIMPLLSGIYTSTVKPSD